MRITDIKIDAFGIWSDLELSSLGQQLTVFYGPNEAGKTTLLQFVRSMIFGFSGERRKRYLPASGRLAVGGWGGSLGVTSSQGSFAIARHDGGRDNVIGDLRISGSDGALQSDHLLSALVCGVDEPTFNHVFAVGLRDIQELATLGDTAAAAMLYGLTTGLDRISLAEVLRELGASRGRLLAPDGRGSIAQLLADRDRLRAEVSPLRDQSHVYGQLLAERKRLDHEIEEAERTGADIERRQRLIEAAARVRDPWHRRVDVNSQLAALTGVADLPVGALEEFDRLSGRLVRRRRTLTRLKHDHRDVRRQSARLGGTERVDGLAPRIEALLEQRSWAASLEADVGRLSAEIAALEGQLSSERSGLGLKSAAADAPLAINRQSLARLRAAASALRHARAHIKACKDQHEETTKKAAGLGGEIRTALADRPEKDLQPALEKAGNLVNQLRRRVQLDEQAEKLSRTRADVDQKIHLLMDQQILPVWIIASLGGVFALGVMLLLASLVFGSRFFGPTGWTLSLMGLIGTIASAGGKYYLERSAEMQLEAGQKQLATLDGQIKQAKQDRETLDSQLPRGGGPLLTRLQAAEKDLARLEELMSLDGNRSVAQQEAEAVRKQFRAARDAHDEAQSKWRQALAAAGLPDDFPLKAVKHLASRRTAMGETAVRLERLRNDHQQRGRELDGFTGRLKGLLDELELKPLGSGFDDHFRQLQDALRERTALATKRDQLHQRAGELRRLGVKAERSIRRMRRQIAVLFKQAGVAGPVEFRDRALQSARVQQLRTDRETLDRDIAASLGTFVTEDALKQHFALPAAERLVDEQQLAARRLELQRLVQQLAEQRGQLAAQLRNLVDDRRASRAMVDLGRVEQQLHDSIERWQVLAVTQRSLESIRKTYEAERQPATLKEASGYLNQMTDGRYRRVWTPLDEDVLLVDDKVGKAWPVEMLSSGTREQLFLSLRLALASAYASRGARLPLVLDDVLVNFDTHRAKATASVLRDFAATGYQVLVFTCHEHIAEMFKTLKVPTRQLPGHLPPPKPAAKSVVPRPHFEDDDDILQPAAEALEEERAAIPARSDWPVWQPTNTSTDGNGATNGNGVAHVEEDDADSVPIRRPAKKKRKAKRAAEPKIRQSRRARVQDPFAGTIWHEPVEDDGTRAATPSRTKAPFEIEVEDEETVWPDDFDRDTGDDEDVA